MNLLLDPNVVYLILLGGVLLGFLAIVTPGTGMFEIGTLFCFLLAGYGFYHLLFNWWAIIIILLSGIPFVYAIQKPKRELYLGLSMLLLTLGSVFLFPRSETQSGVNPFVAIVSSGFVAIYMWLAVRKSLEAVHLKPAHDLNGLVGKRGETKTTVSEEGSVQVAGELWSARSDQFIPLGCSVKVIRREGFVLVVEKSNAFQS
jgi:membrane-bound ClpP family serine protease